MGRGLKVFIGMLVGGLIGFIAIPMYLAATLGSGEPQVGIVDALSVILLTMFGAIIGAIFGAVSGDSPGQTKPSDGA